MSLVGPRPHAIEHNADFKSRIPKYMLRHKVRPGITGWAQVNGRNAITWEDKFCLDVLYVDHWSLNLDIKILVQTITKVIKREGISQPGHATAEEFMGNEG